MNLANQKCVPCQWDAPKLKPGAARAKLTQIKGWKLIEHNDKIQREFEFTDFVHAMKFVNKIAQIAERIGHHPDFFVSWNRVTVTIYTHKIQGLHANDFILAAKINAIKQTLKNPKRV